ncbi:MAG TPA: RidA family protein [Candidatus Omnitrophota bacterium]|nr:RidA family protein [Candidatus Omnitrophota bacterium]
MERKIIKTENAPLPVGPYNQAVTAGNLVYTSGQIAIDPITNEVSKGGVVEQTRLVLNNLKAVLTASGSSLEHVVKVTVFLKNMNDFSSMNMVYEKFFIPKTAPARSTIEVARLPKDVLVEIEAVAVIQGK